MNEKINYIKHFFAKDIWTITPEDVSSIKYFFVILLRKLILTVKFFMNKGALDSASSLTYSTLLAIVPIFAVVFAIARGFGFSKYIEDWFRDTLSSQPKAAETIIGFVNSYLIHTHSGVFLGVGLLFMLWTIIMLTRYIEQTFNKIWQVKQERGLLRTFTDYLAMFFMLPIIIVVISGITIFMTSIVKQTHEYMLLEPMMRLTIDVMPYIIMSLVFIAFYVFMPNTQVKVKCTIVPGILAGVAMQLLQIFYVNCQMFLSSYNAIYGSFAALPLFMLWVQISWSICLFGAELSYVNQNLESFAYVTQTDEISHRYRMMLSVILLGKICKRFAEGAKPYTVNELKLDTAIPIRIIEDLLEDLEKAFLISESVIIKDDDKQTVYQPATALANITVGALVDKLEAQGKWSLDLDLHKVMNMNTWTRILSIRKGYLKDLYGIQLKDL